LREDWNLAHLAAKLTRFRFSLMGLLVAVALAGLAVRGGMAWVDAAKAQERNLAAVRATLVLPAALCILFDHETSGAQQATLSPAWSDHLWHRIVAAQLSECDKDDTLATLCKMQSLERLVLSGCDFSPSARNEIASLDNPRTLCVAQTEFCDDDLESIAQLAHLRNLYLYQPLLTSAGLRRLEEFTALEELVIVLDWEYFGGLEQNQHRLEAAIPSCHVHLLESGDRSFWNLSMAAYYPQD